MPAAKALLLNTFLANFSVMIAKIAMLGKQLVKPVVRTCYCFSACKNCNTGEAISIAGQTSFDETDRISKYS